MEELIYQYARCTIKHLMAPGEIPVRCERPFRHTGDCLVSVKGEQWNVGQFGYENHAPEKVETSHAVSA